MKNQVPNFSTTESENDKNIFEFFIYLPAVAAQSILANSELNITSMNHAAQAEYLSLL